MDLLCAVSVGSSRVGSNDPYRAAAWFSFALQDRPARERGGESWIPSGGVTAFLCGFQTPFDGRVQIPEAPWKPAASILNQSSPGTGFDSIRIDSNATRCPVALSGKVPPASMAYSPRHGRHGAEGGW